MKLPQQAVIGIWQGEDSVAANELPFTLGMEFLLPRVSFDPFVIVNVNDTFWEPEGSTTLREAARKVVPYPRCQRHPNFRITSYINQAEENFPEKKIKYTYVYTMGTPIFKILSSSLTTLYYTQ